MPSSQSRKNEGFHFVVVDGVPPYCQWQELKDYLRDSAKVNPGYANVLKVNEDGTRVGFCPLRNKTEANKAFEYLVAEGWRGLDIRVSIVWKADMSSEQIERRRGPEQSQRRRLTNPTPALPSFPSNVPNSSRPTTAGGVSAVYNMAAMARALPIPAHALNSVQPTAMTYGQFPQSQDDESSRTQQQGSVQRAPLAIVPQPPAWSLPQAPPSLRSASSPEPEDRIYTDRQAIHISRLPYDIKAQDLKALLSRFGTVCDIAIKRGKEKRCSATAKYGQASQALSAIQQLNGKRLNKLTLVVRHDRNEAGSVSSAPSTTSRGSDDSDSSGRISRVSSKPTQNSRGPLVVNGARGPGYHKRREQDDDSESFGNSSGKEDFQEKPRASTTARGASRKPMQQSNRR